ncbi:MAG: type I restriction-modification system subunit M [Bacteroidales bacterium]|nr:type I restriction-modification system subunit M [Bacteroidales bacterium]
MNKQQLAAKIWESANKMRSKIEANEYKDYILGFIFYKYLSEQEVKYAKSQDFTDEDIKKLVEEDAETMEFIRDQIGYFISYDNLFSTWINKGRDFDVSNVRDAISAFNRTISTRHKKIFQGIFHTLETGLSKLGDSSGAQTKAIRDLIDLIDDIPMNGQQSYDVLGFIYEYLISQFAANAGKKAGEFYTPHEVSLLMSEIVANHLKDEPEISIYDPTSGSGSLLINIGSSVAKQMQNRNNIKYYAQELKENTYNLTRMNLVMRGILVDNIVTRNADTLEDDWPYFDENDPVNTYNPLYVDAVVSNPPYSQHWDSTDKEADPRYARFGLAPKTKADYAFLLHDLYHLKPTGIMAIVLPHGVLFRGGEEGNIRKNLIESNHIDTIIGLPPNIFFGTGIPTIVMILKQRRTNTDVLIIDASKGFIKVGKNNQLRTSDIKRISDTVIQRIDSPKFSKLVTRNTIRANDYNLNIPRYVDSSDDAETWDIYASMFGGIPHAEIDSLQKFWTAFPALRESLFSAATEHTAQLNSGYLKEIISQHPDVMQYVEAFNLAFNSFSLSLKTELIDNMLTLNIPSKEEELSRDIFNRLVPIPLIDKYNAYQILSDHWEFTAGDLEILQADGFGAARIVDPNMLTKKRAGKDVEVQEGWKGKIIPFDLVQSSILKADLDALTAKENRLSEITSEFSEILDSLDEDEKEHEAINEAKDGFIAAIITKTAKEIRDELKKDEQPEPDSFEEKILKVSALIAEEKTLRKELREETDALHIKTKNTIESLTDEQVNDMLYLKWIEPLVNSLFNLPVQIVNDLSAKLQNLADKYAITYSDTVNQINQTEQQLSLLINELTGSDFDMQGLTQFQSLLKGE